MRLHTSSLVTLTVQLMVRIFCRLTMKTWIILMQIWGAFPVSQPYYDRMDFMFQLKCLKVIWCKISLVLQTLFKDEKADCNFPMFDNFSFHSSLPVNYASDITKGLHLLQCLPSSWMQSLCNTLILRAFDLARSILSPMNSVSDEYIVYKFYVLL